MFDGKVVLVTGGGSGIGAEIATAFDRLGAVVNVFDIIHPKKYTGVGEYYCVDVSSAAEVAKSVEAIVKVNEQIDIVVNNAGIIKRADVINTDEKDWDSIIDINLKGCYLVCKHVLPTMIKRGFGRIINIGSGWGVVGGSAAAAYCASKGGLILLTKAMAMDHGKQGVTVNCICPGDTETPMLAHEESELGLKEGVLVKAGKNRPVGRIGQPSDVANAALFLAMESSGFVTGITLPVDGGGLAGF